MKKKTSPPWRASCVQSAEGRTRRGERLTFNVESPEPIMAKDGEEIDGMLCRAAVQIPMTATGELMFMPGGLQEITPFKGGQGKPIKIMVDQGAVAALEEQRAALNARGKRPYFDFNHEDGPASFWPEQFTWKAGGIFAKGEWTSRGREAVEGKEWREFSPVFFVDNKSGNPARIICAAGAPPNMGGLVNNAAFHNILPLWAKNAGASSAQDKPTKKETMTPEEIAALQAKNTELQTELDSLKKQQSQLKAKNESDALVAAEIKAKEQELKANASALEVEALKAKNKEQGNAISARNKSDAEAAVKAAVERGAVLAKDTKTQESLIALATADPAQIATIQQLQGNSAITGGRITQSANGGNVVVTAEAPSAILKGFQAVLARNAALKLSAETYKQKGALAREAAAIFARDIEKNDVLQGITIDEAIKAADVTDTNVGLLAGTLVLQRALPLLQFEYPVLSSVVTDFSDAPGLYKQTEVTRILVKPAVQTYDTTTDTAGRPKGWSTVSPAQSVDVSITLDEYVGIPIVFGVNTLAQTMRRLFEEAAPQSLYALGGYFVKKLAALFTSGNYPAYAGTTVAAVTFVSGNASVTVTSGDTTQMYPGQAVADASNTNVPLNTYVASITDSTHFVMTQKAKASNTGVALTIGPGFDDAGAVLPIPTTYASYVEALADFNMASLGKIGAAFDSGMVPQSGRAVMLNASYYQRLAQDPTFNTFFAAMRAPDVINKGILPELQGFTPQKAPWFPSSSNRVGFAYHSSAALIKTRLPQDFTNAVGAMIPGSVTTVTAPSGISVLLVQYVNLQGNFAEWRPEIMLGVAVGERRSGLVLASA